MVHNDGGGDVDVFFVVVVVVLNYLCGVHYVVHKSS